MDSKQSTNRSVFSLKAIWSDTVHQFLKRPTASNRAPSSCRGMRQVQEISDASIMKQLALDESEWSDMVAEMRKTNVTLRREKDAYQEINRILLRENLDLRDTLREESLLDESQLKDLKDLYSVFGDTDTPSEEEGTDDKQ